jgi:hypothetical protein
VSGLVLQQQASRGGLVRQRRAGLLHTLVQAATPPSTPASRAPQSLDLSNNRLHRLPAGLGWAPALRQLNVTGNPSLVTPPKPVLAKGLKAVLSFLQARALAGAAAGWRGSAAAAVALRRQAHGRIQQSPLSRARRWCASRPRWWRRTWARSVSRSWRWRRRAGST